MSVNISSPGLNKFNTDWFTVDGPYAKVKKEYENTFFETLDKTHEAQKTVSAQAREKLVEKLTPEQVNYLSATYDPEKMNYGEYRSFINDLCQFGYFAEEDKSSVSCGVYTDDLILIPVSGSHRIQGALTTASYVPGIDSFPSSGGNVLAWVKYMATFGTYNSSGAFEKTDKALLFEKLQNILLQMKH